MQTTPDPDAERFVQRTRRSGARVDLTHANSLVADWDDEAILAVMSAAEV